MLSVRIFRCCVVGHECFFKCWAIELVSERCIVSLLNRVVEVKPTYILLLSEIQSPKGHLNLYITLVFCKTPFEGEELFLMTRFEVFIIIIMSCRQRGYPWPSLAISSYHSSPPAGLQGYILCPHIVAVCKFVLVVLLLHIHKWGSTGVHRLWARPCFSSSVPRVWFVYLV